MMAGSPVLNAILVALGTLGAALLVASILILLWEIVTFGDGE